MSILEISQIIFNFIISFAAIIITIWIIFVAYNLIRFINAIKKLMIAVDKGTSEIYERVNKFLENIFNFSFISRFFRKDNVNEKNKK
ncbi:MAG: hypothetical protein WC711_00215 [Candidatus Staskawiczbacteria bacterium]|jgi:hypothetical protein